MTFSFSRHRNYDMENIDAAIELKLYYDSMPRICVVSDAA